MDAGLAGDAGAGHADAAGEPSAADGGSPDSVDSCAWTEVVDGDGWTEVTVPESQPVSPCPSAPTFELDDTKYKYARMLEVQADGPLVVAAGQMSPSDSGWSDSRLWLSRLQPDGHSAWEVHVDNANLPVGLAVHAASGVIRAVAYSKSGPGVVEQTVGADGVLGAQNDLDATADTQVRGALRTPDGWLLYGETWIQKLGSGVIELRPWAAFVADNGAGSWKKSYDSLLASGLADRWVAAAWLDGHAHLLGTYVTSTWTGSKVQGPSLVVRLTATGELQWQTPSSVRAPGAMAAFAKGLLVAGKSAKSEAAAVFAVDGQGAMIPGTPFELSGLSHLEPWRAMATPDGGALLLFSTWDASSFWPVKTAMGTAVVRLDAAAQPLWAQKYFPSLSLPVKKPYPVLRSAVVWNDRILMVGSKYNWFEPAGYNWYSGEPWRIQVDALGRLGCACTTDADCATAGPCDAPACLGGLCFSGSAAPPSACSAPPP